MFSIFFINRPIFAKVISIFIFTIGLIALFTLPIEQFPQMTPPVVQINATYPGGSASVVEQDVTLPLELSWYDLHDLGEW
jgi:HAE1 family hydrophobic/amphiphilic exporter-1